MQYAPFHGKSARILPAKLTQMSESNYSIHGTWAYREATVTTFIICVFDGYIIFITCITIIYIIYGI